ncbi:MAG: acylphosphatase [Nitrospirae bacterium]|nr:acylphosphatase [Nitrospirota bacterium]
MANEERDLVRAHVLITGMVQGVFFRAHTREEAHRLGLSGWVRNLRDGRVEALFEGERPAVKEMVRWCHKGPSSAVVRNVDVRWEPAKDEQRSFEIRYD